MRAGKFAAGLILAFALSAISAGATTVQKHGGYRYVTGSHQLKRGAQVRYEVRCPKGTYVYGGGQSNDGNFGTIQQRQEYPFDDGDKGSRPEDGYAVLVKNMASFSVKVSPMAICGKERAAYRQRKVEIEAGGSTNEVDERCGPAGSLVGGGAGGASRLLVQSGGPIDYNGGDWYAYAGNRSATKPVTMTQYAICAPGIATDFVDTGPVNFVQMGMTGRQEAHCPADEFALSGGQGNSGSVTTNSSYTHTFRSWVTFGDNTADSQRSLSALVACAPHA